MDALELVRQRARARRRGALATARTATPATDAWETVRAAARQQDYDLIPLEPDDALLSGAEAVLDRGIEAIFYNGTVSAELAPALIAHELGHLDLHDGTIACGEEEIDASSPDEPTPAGVHRIEAYGARERQELQANVYARELLLPRHETRRLFLDEKLKASQVAAAIRLPLDLVRQQFCESLLTPEPPAVSEPPAPRSQASAAPPMRFELDPFQRTAAEHAGSPLLLEAGPGTGKTRTLVARIVHLIDNGVDPASILALTFSNKAAREITDRVAETLPRQAPVIWTGTFHAFGLEILRKHHHLVGLDEDIRILDRSDAIAMLEEALPALGLKHHQNLYEPALELKEILAAISRAKDELVDAADYAALAEEMRKNAVSKETYRAAERAAEVATVYDMVQRTLKWRKAVDFGDLIMRPVRLLESRPAVRDALRLRHRHVLVDEYQDVNRASARLLKLLVGDGDRLWVVGDSRQSIYRFRGASTSNMALFEEDFPGAERKALGINYRSSREIVDAFSEFGRRMRISDQVLELDLEAHRGSAVAGGFGAKPDLCVTADRDSEISAIAARILRLRDAGVALAEQAVLCRSNAKLNAISAGLEARGIPVLHLGSLFERDEVRDMLSLLWLVVDFRGGALMRLAAFDAYSVPIEDVRRYLEAVREKDVSAFEGLDQPEAVEGLSEAAAAGLARLGRDLAGVEKTSMPWQILADYLFDKSAYLPRLVRSATHGASSSAAMRCIALYQFLNFVRTARPGGRGFPSTRLLDKVRRLVLLAEERDLRQIPATALHLHGVKLMTIHGSKGLEFEAVHIPAMTTSSLPSNFRPPRCPPPTGMIAWPASDGGDPVRESHHAEEECLFFVALSRARSTLHLYRSRQVGNVRRKPSRVLAHIRLAPAVPEAVEPLAEPAGERPVALARARPADTSTADLAAFERCPRRFFYSRIFGLPGTTRAGAFIKTHRSIYAVLDWLKTRPPGPFPANDEAISQLDEAWQRSGPTGHAFEKQYRLLAEKIVGNLIASHDGMTLDAAEPLEVVLPAGTVVAEPDLWARLSDDRKLLQVIRTGRKGGFRGDDTIYGLFETGARLRYGTDGFELEVLHLTDRKRTPINMSLEKIESRLIKSDSCLEDMAAGRFPAHPDPFTCPRCPYFFVCPTVPSGPLRIDTE